MVAAVEREAAQKAVVSGFKQTEIGLIPEDWDLVALGEISHFRTGPFGSSLHKSDYVLNGIPLINPMHIVDGQLYPSDQMTIDEAAASRLRDFCLSIDDIIIGRRGDMGRCAVVRQQQDGWLCGTGCMIVRPKKNALNSDYAQRLLSSAKYVARIEDASVGSTMTNLNQSVLSGLPFPLPPLPEQEAIAGTLSDTDEAIRAVERLLDKQRAVKHAALHALLTPTTRIPGFSGDWETKTLGECATLKARIGWQGLTTEEYLSSGDYGLVTGTDFASGRVDWSRTVFVERGRYEQDKYIQLRKGDILITKDGTIGKSAFVDKLPVPATLNSGVFVIRPKDEAFDPEFFYHLLTSFVFDEFLKRLSAGSTINHLYQKDFITFDFPNPTLPEQRAIAAVLSDMDAVIAALEARRDKLKAVKQGIMQALLTGKVRLV